MIQSQHTTLINLPIHEVMNLFNNQDYFKNWQKNLVSFKNTSKEIGLKGSTRSMILKIAGTHITLNEEITLVDLPHTWQAVYRTSGVINTQTNTFTEQVDDKTGQLVTLWESHSTYRFTGMMRLISKATPDLFTGQTKQLMTDFKSFAESLRTKKSAR